MATDVAIRAIAEFRNKLVIRREEAGNPTYRKLEAASRRIRHFPRLSHSTMHDNLKDGAKVAVYKWDFVAAFVLACRVCELGLGRELTGSQIREELGRINPDYVAMLKAVEGDRLHARLAKEAAEQLRLLKTPRQLPPRIPHFVGRVSVLEELDQMMASRNTVVIWAIDGMAGVGKTTVAVQWAHQIADQFPDGQLYVNLRGFDSAGPPLSPVQVAHRFLEAFAVPPLAIPKDPEAVVDLYRSQVADLKVLLMLDNAANAEQVRRLLPSSSRSLTIVTSRRRLDGLVATHGARVLNLNLFSVAEGKELLACQVGNPRTDAEPVATDEIITLCARLPLALTIVAARAAVSRDKPLTEFARELRDAKRALDALRLDSDDEDPLTDLRAVFSWSYNQLGTGAARLFRLLGLHPGPDISAAAAASLARLSEVEVGRLLDELGSANLVKQDERGRFVAHDLIRAYAQERAEVVDSPAQRREALQRVIDHYLYSADNASRRWDPLRDPIGLSAPHPGTMPETFEDRTQTVTWLTTEYPVLRNFLLLAAAEGLSTEAWQLGWSLTDFLNRHGHWQDWLTLQEAALEAAKRARDLPGEARSRRSLGRAYIVLGQPETSLEQLMVALQLFGQLDDDAGLGHTHVDMCRTYYALGQFRDALNAAEQAVQQFKAAQHPTGEANALNAAGWIQAQLGNYELTLKYCEKALPVLVSCA